MFIYEFIITFIVLSIFFIIFIFSIKNNQINLETNAETESVLSNITQLGEISEINGINNYINFNPNGIIHKNKTIIIYRCLEKNTSLVFYCYMDLMKKQFFSNPQKISINLNKPILNGNFLGFEDMRIFEYRKELYIIGVNLDRREDGIPNMVLVKLDKKYVNLSKDIWYLNYPPLNKIPNKNWSPIILQNQLCFIVDLDPLLIVKRKFLNNKYIETCEIFYQSINSKLFIKNLRNSTITYKWNDIPVCFHDKLGKICGLRYEKLNRSENFCNKYFLLGHTKFIEKELIIYQHYFIILNFNSDFSDYEIYISNPFYLEEKYKPHIEYISGVSFDKNNMYIFYGLRDKQCKYLIISSEKLIF